MEILYQILQMILIQLKIQHKPQLQVLILLQLPLLHNRQPAQLLQLQPPQLHQPPLQLHQPHHTVLQLILPQLQPQLIPHTPQPPPLPTTT